MPSDMQNLDPTLSSADIPTQEMLTNVYSWLIDYKLVNQSGHPYGDPNQFVGGLAQSWTMMDNGKVVRAHETASDPYAHNWLATHTTGTETGPYELRSWQPGNQWVLVANPNYY